tara:strand:+ start:5166 stop:5459 length:294 start_codon:yes stop_codon:yes gene_type:complete
MKRLYDILASKSNMPAHLRSLVRSLLKKHINVSNPHLNNSKKLENPKLELTEKTCSKCENTYSLNSEYFQVVKTFEKGYSFYCNECDEGEKHPIWKY